MKTPLLIAIHGVKRSGKGTAFHFVKEWGGALGLSAYERGFADKVKWALARIFFPDITLEEAVRWVDDLKEDTDCLLFAPHKDNYNSEIAITMREAAQHVGSEVGRDIFGEDFWVNQLLPISGWQTEFTLGNGTPDIYGVTDLRFKNEFFRVKQLAGVTIKIRRRAAEQAVIDEAEAKGRALHGSELGLPDEWFDHVISNDGTKDELAAAVQSVMDSYK